MILEMAGRAAQILIALAGGYLVVLWFALIVWTFRDIETRSRSVFTQVFSTLLTVLFFVPGTLLYLLLRPKTTLDEAFQRSLEEEYLLQDLEELPHCPNCHRFVEDDYQLCPSCQTQLRERCGTCERLIELRWPLCPYCGSVHAEERALEEKVEAPAARWTSPALRRRRGAETLARPRAIPRVGAGDEREQLTARARSESDTGDLDESSTLVASLTSGMRSIVRPIDRLLGRGEPSEASRSATDEPAGVFRNGHGYGPTTTTPADGNEHGTAARDNVGPVPARNRFQAPDDAGAGREIDRGVRRDGGSGETEQVDAYAHRNGRHQTSADTWGPAKRDS